MAKPPKTKRVYYLTGCMPAIANIALGRLKISRFNDLNDPFELMGANMANLDLRRALRRNRDALHIERGLICFTKDWSNPLMWGHYADKHSGMALGFNVLEEDLTTIRYTDKPFDFKLNKHGEFEAAHLDFLITTKFQHWQYEAESRKFIPLSGLVAEGGLYFEKFSERLKLVEVVLGPRCVYDVKAVHGLVAKLYRHKIEVIKARIAYQEFAVRKNLKASRAEGPP